MHAKGLLSLVLGCFVVTYAPAQEKKDTLAEKDYVRIEVRGKLEIKGDSVLIKAVPTNFTDAQTWPLVFWKIPKALQAAEKLEGKTVVVKGDLRFVSGKMDKNGKHTMDNRPFHPTTGQYMIFVRDLTVPVPAKEK
jgi:hypothetical protein